MLCQCQSHLDLCRDTCALDQTTHPHIREDCRTLRDNASKHTEPNEDWKVAVQSILEPSANETSLANAPWTGSASD